MKYHTRWSALYTIAGVMLLIPGLLMLASVFNPGNALLVNLVALSFLVCWVGFLTIVLLVAIVVYLQHIRSN